MWLSLIYNWAEPYHIDENGQSYWTWHNSDQEKGPTTENKSEENYTAVLTAHQCSELGRTKNPEDVDNQVLEYIDLNIEYLQYLVIEC